MTDRTLASPADLDGLDFEKGEGLLPVVAQDARDGRVLMVAWASRAALERTLETRKACFWSRSRERLWMKGETTGNVLELVSLHADCDGDTVLARVRPTGPACHTGDATCFGDGAEPERSSAAILHELEEVLRSRQEERPEGSWTVRLLDDENLRLKKLGEETAELLTALARGEADRIPEEAADLVYHVLAALRGAEVELEEVFRVLAERRG